MEVIMQWGSITLLSVLAFLIGWYMFGLGGAILLAIIVCVLTGILTVVV